MQFNWLAAIFLAAGIIGMAVAVHGQIRARTVIGLFFAPVISGSLAGTYLGASLMGAGNEGIIERIYGIIMMALMGATFALPFAAIVTFIGAPIHMYLSEKLKPTLPNVMAIATIFGLIVVVGQALFFGGKGEWEFYLIMSLMSGFIFYRIDQGKWIS